MSGAHHPGTVREIAYRLPWRIDSAVVGAHRGPSGGGLGVFRDVVDFWRQPDARRIDLRQTLRDPWQQVQVRRFEQRAATTVVAIVDLSGSMRFGGRHGDKLQRAAEVCQGVALFARRIGDAFGMVGCDDRVRPDFMLRPTRRRGIERDIARRFAAVDAVGAGATALPSAAMHLPARRTLVLLISDFRLPLPLLEQTLRSLCAHDVVPLQVEDPRETDGLPRWGLLDVRDMESGRRRLLLMRPALRAAWLAAEHDRHQALAVLFARYGRRAFRLTDRWRPERLSEHLLAR